VELLLIAITGEVGSLDNSNNDPRIGYAS
jgi:hypothetical protein